MVQSILSQGSAGILCHSKKQIGCINNTVATQVVVVLISLVILALETNCVWQLPSHWLYSWW